MAYARPSAGATPRTLPGVSDMRMGTFSVTTSPASGSVNRYQESGGGVLLVVLELIFDVLHDGGADADALATISITSYGSCCERPARHPLIELFFVTHRAVSGWRIFRSRFEPRFFQQTAQKRCHSSSV